MTMRTRVSSRARRPSAFTLVLGSICHECSGSVRFTCFHQALIPRVWIGERIFANIEFKVSAHGERTCVKGKHQRRILTITNSRFHLQHTICKHTHRILQTPSHLLFTTIIWLERERRHIITPIHTQPSFLRYQQDLSFSFLYL
jgi:hypothetical protein